MSSITLINTPKKDFGLNKPGTEYNVNEKYPVGLLLISSQLKAHRETLGLDVNFLDANFYHSTPEDIAKAVNSEYVGMNTTFPNAGVVKKTSRLIKEASPSTTIILGGPAATLAPQYFLDENVDYVVRGEGERTILDLLHSHISNGDMSSVKGIAYRELEGMVLTSARERIQADEIPFIDVSEIPKELRQAEDEIQMFTSRGCTHNCSYCSTPPIWGHGKNYRTQSNERIFKELENYRKKGFNFNKVYFVDDNFTGDKARTQDFTQEWQRKYGTEASWKCLSRVNDLNSKKSIRQLIKGGCSSVSVGIESVTPRILKNIRKALSVKDATSFLEKTSSMGLNTKGFAMIGFPTETESEALDTINYMAQAPFGEAAINIAMAYPGTAIHNQVYGESRLVVPKFTSHKIKSANPRVIQALRRYSTFPTTSLSENISAKRLHELKEHAFELFYSSR